MKLPTLKDGLKRARKNYILYDSNGNKIKFTQKLLAKTINVSLDTVRNWEQGKAMPSLDMLLKLSDLYQCDLDYLTGKIDCKTHEKQFICNEIGLSEMTIDKLRQMKQADQTTALQIISDLLTAPDFDKIIACFLDLYTNALQQKDMNMLKTTVSEKEMSALVKSLDQSDIIEKSEKYKLIEWYLNEYKQKAAALVNNGQFLKSTYADISRLSWNLAESYYRDKSGQ